MKNVFCVEVAVQTDQEYCRAQERLINLTNIVLGTDIEGYLRRLRIEKTEARVLDPDLYGDEFQNWRALEDIAIEAAALKTRLQRIREKYRKRSYREREETL